MSDPEELDAIVTRYKHYVLEWRAKGRDKEAEAMEDVIARLESGMAKDPRTVAPTGDA